jgi:hypothetical protein
MANKTNSNQNKCFRDVFRAELTDISARRHHTKRAPLDEQIVDPSTLLNFTGLALSGGGIRSASFSLGVLQGLTRADAIRHMDYLSTVSGGGYVGASMTIAMSKNGGYFPFARSASDVGETPETQHIRDNARYLVPNGIGSAVAALAVYLRGIAMNALVLLPILLAAAALIVFLYPDTKALVSSTVLGSIIKIGGAVFCALWAAYAILVSVAPIASLRQRQHLAIAAAVFLAAYLLVVILALQPCLMRAIFQEDMLIALPPDSSPAPKEQLFERLLLGFAQFIKMLSPAALLILPFVKKLGVKALTPTKGGWIGLATQIASRILLLFAAAIVPLVLYLFMIKLAYWGVGVSTCDRQFIPLTECHARIVNIWDHAPDLLRSLTEYSGFSIPELYALGALLLFLSWPFLSVNANSLHQLYRDRLGSAFFFEPGEHGAPVSADDFQLTKIDPRLTPYHLINTSLNVPGSEHANRRGRDADFFLFSKRFIGSDVTGYVETEAAETVVDRLNIGTAMAISGAAVAPNMGTASIKPLSPTLAFLNFRLGRWLLHPSAIAARVASIQGGRRYSWRQRIPGPRYLLREAFSKSGLGLKKDAHIRTGFIFLTDGGHLENLGVYELLRRRCRLIVAVDAEEDPKLLFPGLVQLERFARIDLNVKISLCLRPLADLVSEASADKKVPSTAGPHVALGFIDYPSLVEGPPERGVLVYIKASCTGDENDYVRAYKERHPSFPHETTGDQFFSEEQVEVYRALGEHIASRFVQGLDDVSVDAADYDELISTVRSVLPGVEILKKNAPASNFLEHAMKECL